MAVSRSVSPSKSNSPQRPILMDIFLVIFEEAGVGKVVNGRFTRETQRLGLKYRSSSNFPVN